MASFPVSGVPGAIAYLRPSHARPDRPILLVKSPSWPKGVTPPHLRTYLGQVREAPRTCRGRKGQSYRECLIRETARLRRGA